MSAKPPSSPVVILPPLAGPGILVRPAQDALPPLVRVCPWCGRTTTLAEAARGACVGCGAPVLVGGAP